MVDLERHSRHVLLPQVGAAGQAKISQAKIACIGAGGLGAPVLQYLAAAGVGHLTIIDDDVVEISNLQRQVIHRSQDVGIPKAESAKRFISDLDSSIRVVTHVLRLNESNAAEILKDHDIVIDGTDNIPTRYCIDDTCKNLGIPWIYGSVYRFEGQVSTFNLANGPCYRDLFPEPPPEGSVPSCSEAGVLGVLPGLIGCYQVNEAIKIILGIGESLSGRLLVIDTLGTSQRQLKFKSENKRSIHQPDSEPEESMFNHIDAENTLARLKEGWKPFVLDVRSNMEYEQAHISWCDLQHPHEQVIEVAQQIPKDSDVLIHCRSGMRSQIAALLLMQEGFDGQQLYNLDGGIQAIQALDPGCIVQG